ncbi:type I-E CRISPR-associated protein Cas5/CasD [Okibacterium endophyticum]
MLRLAAPLQSWGASSRFVRRETKPYPTKSGVLGLIAAAQGRRRTDPVEDLVKMTFGVRVEQPGRLVRDFQTARSLDGAKRMPLSYRFYLSDAVFIAGVQADRTLLDGIADAIERPVFPLFFGRRSCPPASPLVLGIRDGDLAPVMKAEPWRASVWHQKQTHASSVTLDFYRDALHPDEDGDPERDEPISFSQERREYAWRTVVRDVIEVENAHHRRVTPDGAEQTGARSAPQEHDVFAAIGGS